MLLSERIAAVVEHVRRELSLAMQEMAAYVEQLEHDLMQVVDGSAGIYITELSTICQNLNNELQKYTLFFPDLAKMVRETDDAVQSLADRFLARARKEYTEINSRIAMEVFSRSRSTIYRWIKKGKLLAEKRGRFWTIFVETSLLASRGIVPLQ